MALPTVPESAVWSAVIGIFSTSAFICIHRLDAAPFCVIAFAILSQRIHRLVNGRQIRLSILRKEVNIGIFAVPDHLFDDGAQQAAFFLQRGRIHRAGKGFDHFLMEGELLMEHPALLGEGFQLGKSCLLSLALLMQFVDLLHDVLRGGVAGNGQGLHQPLDALFHLGVLLFQQCQLCVVALLAAADNLLGLR